MSAAIILAGGRSARMGQDKRRLRLWGAQGPTLLERTVVLATGLCSEVIVVLNDPEAWPDLRARLVPDTYPGAGPLGGLASGLAALETDRALLLACDLPLLQPDLLHALCSEPLDGDALVLRRWDSVCGSQPQLRAEPLLAIYHRRCLPVITACLTQDVRRMGVLLNQIAVRYLDPAWWSCFHSDGRLFLNLNHPADLTRAAQLLGTDLPLAI